MNKIKAEHVIAGIGLLASAAIAVENYYEHPTYGRGLQALYAAGRAAIFYGV